MSEAEAASLRQAGRQLEAALSGLESRIRQLIESRISKISSDNQRSDAVRSLALEASEAIGEAIEEVRAALETTDR